MERIVGDVFLTIETMERYSYIACFYPKSIAAETAGEVMIWQIRAQQTKSSQSH